MTTREKETCRLSGSGAGIGAHPARDVNRWAVDRFVRNTAGEVPAGAFVLDAGAGEGRYRALFQGCRYVAVDLAVGDERWDYSGVDVLADLGRLPFLSESVPVVLSTQTLEHLARPWEFLAEAARVLAPGGRLYVTAPQSFRLHQAPHDYYRFTAYGIRHLLSQAGLQVVSVTPQGGYFWFLADAIRPLHRRLFGKERSLVWRVATAPLALVSKALFTRLLPLLLFRLDFLDRRRAFTTGHEAVAVKPQGRRT